MNLRRTAILAILAIGCAWVPARPAPAQDTAQFLKTLGEHGVPTTSDGLVRFLENGWQAARPQRPLPALPPEKITLLIQSWIVLTLRYEDIRKAGPALRAPLADLALAYAQAKFSPGIQEMLDQDLGALGPAQRTAKREGLTRLLRYNGMVALGFYGMANDATRAEARTLYERETDPVVRVTYARTLVLLGDRAALADLADAVRPADRGASVAAANALHVLLGRSFGLRSSQAIGPRRQAAAELLAWWESLDPATVPMEREAAILRQIHPVDDRLDDPSAVATVRDLLRRSADPADSSDRHGSRSAWLSLNAMKKEALLAELEPILANPDEDLDIRTEAIRWYVLVKGKSGARSRLKSLRKDPNPEVTDLVKALLGG